MTAKRRRWTPQAKLEVLQRIQAGESASVIAAEWGLDESEIELWARRYRTHGFIGLHHKAMQALRKMERAL